MSLRTRLNLLEKSFKREQTLGYQRRYMMTMMMMKWCYWMSTPSSPHHQLSDCSLRSISTELGLDLLHRYLQLAPITWLQPLYL